MIAELIAVNGGMPTRMQSERFSGCAEVGETYIDEQWAMMVIEGALPTDKELDVFDQ